MSKARLNAKSPRWLANQPHGFDYRHDFGTKLLRDCGNLKLVQKAMNHTDIKSTLRYAHVNDKEIAAAVERVLGKVPGQSLGA